MKEHIFSCTEQELTNGLQAKSVEKPYLAYLTDTGEYNFNQIDYPYASFTQEPGTLSKNIKKKGVTGATFYVSTISGNTVCVSTEDNWITLAPSAISYSGLITFSVSANQTEDTRTGKIIVDFWPSEYHQDDPKDVKMELSVVQAGVIDWTEEPLTLIFKESGTPAVAFNASNTYYYNYNNEGWEETLPSAVTSGDTLAIMCSATTYHYQSTSVNSFAEMPAFEVAGNVMSMLYGEDFLSATGSTIALRYFFRNSKVESAANLYVPELESAAQNMLGAFFAGCTGLTTGPATLPTTSGNYFASQMFSGCTSLTSAPALPATRLSQNCYANMFNGCTSLTSAPALPARGLAVGCYASMFRNCTALTTAPELPAATIGGTTSSNGSYAQMFNGCSSLNSVKCLAENPNTNICYRWLLNVAQTGTFIKKKNVSWSEGESGIPSGWTVQEVE